MPALFAVPAGYQVVAHVPETTLQGIKRVTRGNILFHDEPFAPGTLCLRHERRKIQVSRADFRHEGLILFEIKPVILQVEGW